MKIGIDLDGVLFDSEKEYRVYSELYDVIDLNKNSKVNNKELYFQNRFNWSQEETAGFWDKYHRKIVKESNYMPGAKDIIKLLKSEGYELIIVTARGSEDKELIQITQERLMQTQMDIFDKYYWAVKDKAEVCENENIDIMIDDFCVNCENVAKRNIKTIYLKDAPSYDMEENENLKVLYNWGEIYRFIKDMERR